jgi:hypothetical protein
MAITRAQQARQMLKNGTKPVVQGGVDNYLGKQPQVVAPRKWQSGPDKPPTELAYITEAEKKLLLKEDIHGSLKDGPNKGPAGIISLDSFGDIGGAGAAGGDTEAGGGAMEGRGFSGRGPSETKSAFEARKRNQREIFQAAEKKQARNLGIRERKNVIDMNRPGRFGFNPLATLLGFVNPVLGLAARGIMGIPNVAKKFKASNTLSDFLKSLKTPTGVSTEDDNTTLLDQVSPELPFAKSYLNQLQSKMTPKITIDDDMSLTPDMGLKTAPGDSLDTPFQQDIKQDNFLENAMADLNPLGLTQMRNLEKKKGMEEFGGPTFTEEDAEMLKELQRRDADPTKTYGPILAADGGMIGGGIMDAAGRQQYFLGKLVKKAKRAVKKIVKSPIGKIGLLAAGGFGLKSAGLLSKLYTGGKLTGMGKLALGAGISSLPLLFGQEEEEQPTGFTGSVGGQIDPRAYTDPYGVLFPAFRAEGSPKEGEKGIMKVASGPDMTDTLNELANQLFGKDLRLLTEEEMDMLRDEAERLRSKFMAEGGSAKEPVAKRTMPLLDMGGQEMDLRAEGGFVPIGRMEKADDVPARLSKNEFVFTADAVRNAGDGDVDKGAEVMYNMMKNLEAGGDVSEESQGLEGARNMFQTSKRLEEVI